MLVRVFANLRQICGGVGVEVNPEGQRVIDVLDKMVEMFPDLKDELFTAEKKAASICSCFYKRKKYYSFGWT